MWVLLGPGDAVLVPSPSYPIHIWGPLFAGADVREVPMTPTQRRRAVPRADPDAFEHSWPRPRVIVLSFPHNPTTACVDLDFFQRLVDFAREKEVMVVHDNAYAELGFDGWQPPSILQAEGAKECAVELYSMTKSFSMAGWRVAFLVGNPEVVAGAGQAEVATSTTAPSSRSRSRPPSRSTRPRTSRSEVARRSTSPAATRSATASTASAGTSARPKGTMFAWAPIPEPYREMGSIEFARSSCTRRRSPPRPASASAPAATATCRFALIENEQRIAQAIRNLKRALTKLG